MPEKAAQTISRERLLAWLERYAATPLRAVIAPPGFGKSVLLAEYAEIHECRYVSIGRLRRMTERLPMVLCVQLGLPTEAGLSVESTLAALATLPTCEIAIDEIDALFPEDLNALAQIVAHAPPHIRVIVAARSRDSIAGPRRLLDGTTATLGAAQLAFTFDDASRLCELFGVEAQPQQISQLVRESDGWPLVAAGAIRAAADAGRTLADAMRLWIVERGVTLREMVLADAGLSDLGPSLVRLCTAKSLMSTEDLQELERAGLYVRRSESGFALLRPVASVFDAQSESLELADLPDVAPMFVQLLGEFDVRIAGRRVEWVRRKDALLFKYLLLEPLGRASRAELSDRFWPTHDKQQAGQNLRTTCSNIRAALRRCLPESRIDLYFRTQGRDVVLRNDLAVTDLSRFTSHIAAAREAMTMQRLDRAAEAYEAARALYRGPLIIDHSNETHDAIARDVDEGFSEIQRHLTALRRLRAGTVPIQSSVA